MTDWNRFAEGLADELATLPSGANVVIIDHHTAPGNNVYYAQFRQFDDTLLAELTSDRFLTEPARPGPGGHRAIIAAGWQSPDEQHNDNWWIDLPWPLTSSIYHTLARMVVDGLHNGLGVPTPDHLVYQAWNDRAGNAPLILTALGVKPEQPQ